MRLALFTSILLAAATASAASGGTPLAVTHTGYLLDAADKPVEAAGLSITFRLFDRKLAENQTLHWEAICSVAVKAGYYAVVLGEAPCAGTASGGLDPVIDTSDLPIGSARYLEIATDGATLSPRLLLAAVPLAAVAARALNADALEAKLAAAGTVNTGTNPVDWTQLKNVPAALADGTDDGATYAAGAGLILSGNTFGLASRGVAAAHVGSGAADEGKALVASAGGGAEWKTVSAPVLTNPSLLGDGLTTPLGVAANAIGSAQLASDAASLARVSGGKLGVADSVLTIGAEVTATMFTGSGAGLTNLPAASLTGAIRLGDVTDCSAVAHYGTVRFSGGAFQGCTSSGWRTFELRSLLADTGTYPNKSTALADGLAMYFRFDETVGSILADSAGAYTMNVLGTGTSGTGKVGNAWNRGTAYANGFKINTGSLDLATFTVAFWWKPTDMTIHSAADGAGLLWLTSTSDNHIVGMNGTTVANRLRFGNFPNTSINARDGGHTLVVNEWHHLTLTCAASVCRVFVNGNQTGASNDLAIKFGAGGASYLAHYFTQTGGNTNNHYGRGLFDEFAVWNRALGADEVAAVFAKQNAGLPLY